MGCDKMNNKNWAKITLDIVMAILLVLLYNANVISLNFHEIGGLFICFLFLIHKILNWKWIAKISRNLLSNTIPLKTKFSYILNLLLLVTFALILVSGILISKTVFTGISAQSPVWKTVHYTAAAAALVFTGAHIGLHLRFITGMLRKVVKIPHAVSKPLSIVLVALVILFGAYSIGTSGFLSWITTPFTAANIQQGSSKPFRNRSKPRKSRRHGKYRKNRKMDWADMEQGKVKTNREILSKQLRVSGERFRPSLVFFAMITYFLDALLRRKRNLFLID